MTDNIPALIAEARRLIAHTRTYNFGMRSADKLAHKVAGELADALEAEHKRADSVQFALDGFRSVARGDSAYLIERAEKAEAERDRYRDLARRTELQCQDAEKEAAHYRAAIERVVAVPNEFEWDVPPTAHHILSRALDENGDE